MNRKPFRKSLSEGRGNCPLPSRSHPQKQTLVVYTEELTHLQEAPERLSWLWQGSGMACGSTSYWRAYATKKRHHQSLTPVSV